MLTRLPEQVAHDLTDCISLLNRTRRNESGKRNQNEKGRFGLERIKNISQGQIEGWNIQEETNQRVLLTAHSGRATVSCIWVSEQPATVRGDWSQIQLDM